MRATPLRSVSEANLIKLECFDRLGRPSVTTGYPWLQVHDFLLGRKSKREILQFFLLYLALRKGVGPLPTNNVSLFVASRMTGPR